jgi:hypothetical protein
MATIVVALQVINSGIAHFYTATAILMTVVRQDGEA